MREKQEKLLGSKTSSSWMFARIPVADAPPKNVVKNVAENDATQYEQFKESQSKEPSRGIMSRLFSRKPAEEKGLGESLLTRSSNETDDKGDEAQEDRGYTPPSL